MMLTSAACGQITGTYTQRNYCLHD